MRTTPTRAILMAGVATLSLTVAAYASEFSRAIVFGDRQIDAGQAPTDFFFLVNDELISDGRRRFTNREDAGINDDSFGNYGATWAMRVSDTLGDGPGGPSQPSNVHSGDTLTGSGNYASHGYGTEEILNSITGQAITPDLEYINSFNGEVETYEGRERAGLLNDEDRQGWAVNSLVIMNGGAQDIRNLANVETLVDGLVDINETRISTDHSTNVITAAAAAGNISDGALALREAGAGLVVVSNLFDQGQTPEAATDADLASQALNGGPVFFEPTEPVVSFADLTALTNENTIRSLRSAGTEAFNEALSANLDGVDGVVILDQNLLVSEVLDNPLRFGLSDEVDHRTQCAVSSLENPCVTNSDVTEIESYFFLNGQDLTTTAHGIIADHAAAVINAPVQVSGLPFTAIASGREVANAGRSQVSAERVARKGWAPFVSAGIGSSTWADLSGEEPHGAMRLTGVAGATYHLGNGFSVGAAAGYQDVSNSSSGTGIEIEGSAVYGTVFAGADVGNVFGNATLTVGSVDYDDVTRVSRIGGASIRNSGSTDGDVFGASIEVGYRALNTQTISVGPIASLDHWSADVGAYDEDGWAATAVNFDTNLDGDSTRASLGLFLEGGDLNYADMPAVFRVKALYTREFDTDPLEVSARTQTSPNNSFTREGRGAQADSMTIGAQLVYDFGPVIGSLNYNVRVGEADDHSGSIDFSVPLGGK